MATVLALDIGTRKTGIAISRDGINVPVSLPTFHGTFTECILHVVSLCTQHQPRIVVVGMPFLLGGKKGEQAYFVERCIQKLKTALADTEISIDTIDERFSSNEKIYDNDASAAISLLTLYLERNNVA